MASRSTKQSAKRARKPKPPPEPTKVVYLFGAGATQAEVSYDGPGNISVLMGDTNDFGEGVSTGVLRRLGTDGDAFKTDKGVDIEKLISLLTASGIDEHLELAEKMRQHYFEEICARLNNAITVERPSLATTLLEMHRNPGFQMEVESLGGIITTNHDGLLQAAFKGTFGSVDVGFPFFSTDLSIPNGNPVPPLLELHGSFTWSFGSPLVITMLSKSSSYSRDASWIPPTVLKESKQYPFNKLIALAYELLSKHCDVLRVIGSSLTQNDWNILSLVFNAQRHNMFLGREPFPIQLIMPQKDGLAIEKTSTYLKNILPIASLKDGGDFSPYEKDEWKTENPPIGDDEANPFFYWLKQKINFHQSKKNFGTEPISATMSKVAGGI
jgi:SIR2-like domain